MHIILELARVFATLGFQFYVSGFGMNIKHFHLTGMKGINGMGYRLKNQSSKVLIFPFYLFLSPVSPLSLLNPPL